MPLGKLNAGRILLPQTHDLLGSSVHPLSQDVLIRMLRQEQTVYEVTEFPGGDLNRAANGFHMRLRLLTHDPQTF